MSQGSKTASWWQAAYDNARGRPLILTGIGITAGALLFLVIAWLAPPIPSPAPSSSTDAASPTQPALAPTMARVEPAAASPPSTAPQPLQREEMRELQKRLRGFGYNPGPIDGAAGRLTTAAVMHYQQDRNRSQTGRADRELLDQLREDPLPQVAMAPPEQRTAQRVVRPTRTAARLPERFWP